MMASMSVWNATLPSYQYLDEFMSIHSLLLLKTTQLQYSGVCVCVCVCMFFKSAYHLSYFANGMLQWYI